MCSTFIAARLACMLFAYMRLEISTYTQNAVSSHRYGRKRAHVAVGRGDTLATGAGHDRECRCDAIKGGSAHPVSKSLRGARGLKRPMER